MSSPRGTVRWLVQMLNEAYHGPAWHGPHLRGTVARVDAATAAWRPPLSGHTIAEITVHAAYWKYAARRRLLGEKRGSFNLKGSNWFTLPVVLSDSQWRDYVALLDAQHTRLMEAVSATTEAGLQVTPAGSKVSNLRLIMGMAMHDVYHAGQIQTVKGQHKRSVRPSR